MPQTSLFNSTTNPQPKIPKRSFIYSMPHPFEEGETIISTSLKKALTAMQSAYPKADNEDLVSLYTFKKKMDSDDFFEIGYGTYVTRSEK